ncbi:lipopolysaccharide biosynthesis protein [Arthrobacter sp. Hor0625]|uniref:lipopolysaccharide biosynthesis protein n=1 Tax=Arthrobacter sp. Hor0625 TaxID=3457358 RepID=UPI00403EC8E2
MSVTGEKQVVDRGASPHSAERRQAARGGVIGISGAAIGSVMGFALTFILARSLGEAGSGVVLQTIAIFTIVLGLAKAGMDTAAVWLLPRLQISDRSTLRGATMALLVPPAVVGSLLALLLAVLAPQLGAGGDADSQQLVQAVQGASWFLPAAAIMMVALAATRALGNIVPYAAIGNIGLPVARPLLVLGSLGLGALGLGTLPVLASIAWAAPAAIAMVAALLILWRRVGAHERGAGSHGPLWPARELNVQIWKFALPRWFSSGVEQSIIWFDVVLVGLIAGAGAAGVYGAASRFVSVGLIVATAMRMVVSPRFSALLGENKTRLVQDLYSTTVSWIVLLGAPVYALFMFFAPTVLGWLGSGFESGSTALIVLCAGALTFLMAGNVDALLMMSGRSGWMAVNKVIVLVLNVLGNLWLVPLWGITGAAVSWAFSLLLDSVLASVESRIFLGIKFGARQVFYALFVAGVCVVPVSLLTRALMGQSTAAVFVAGATSMAALAAWCWLDRKRLHLDDLALLSRSGRREAPAAT